MLKFVHMADVHLGYRQYNSEERALDFAQAFLSAIKFAVERKVDFVLIAGDLFHKKSDIDPLTLTQATKVLEKAKKAGIPVVAVEGNHDSTYYKDSFSWLDYLARSGLIVNLKPEFDEGEMVVEEWDGERGAYVDLDGVRIYGMKYYGSLTEKILEEYSKRIRSGDFTIFMAHVGVEGYVKMHGCVSSNRLHRLKGRVDYVALGHIHRSFVEDDFIFNPGSLETCEITELEFKRGFFYVEFDGEIRYELIENRRRDFVLLEYRMDAPDYEGLRSYLEKHKRDTNPVVDLTITTDRTTRRLIDEERVKKMVVEVLKPIVVRVRWNVSDGFFRPKIDFDGKESIERCVLRQILQNYGYGDIVDEILSLKSIFCRSFNVAMVDRMVEGILFEEGSIGEEQRNEDLKPIGGKSSEEKHKSVESDEEVWDWRKAYVKRSPARKRQKL